MANALLPALRGLGVDVETFGDSTGVLDLNAIAARRPTPPRPKR